MLLFQTLIAILLFALGAVIERDAELDLQQRSELHSWLETAQKGDTIAQGDVVYEILVPHDATLAKRQGTGSCPNAEYQKREVLKTHTEWGDPVVLPGGCMDCFSNRAGCHVTRTLGWSVSQTVSVGFDLGVAGNIADDISANGKFNLGFSWTKGWSGSTSFTCDTPAGKGDRIPVRPKLGVADFRVGTCRSSCINEHCKDWKYGTARYPLKDSHGIAIEPARCETVDSLQACLNGT